MPPPPPSPPSHQSTPPPQHLQPVYITSQCDVTSNVMSNRPATSNLLRRTTSSHVGCPPPPKKKWGSNSFIFWEVLQEVRDFKAVHSIYTTLWKVWGGAIGLLWPPLSKMVVGQCPLTSPVPIPLPTHTHDHIFFLLLLFNSLVCTFPWSLYWMVKPRTWRYMLYLSWLLLFCLAVVKPF